MGKIAFLKYSVLPTYPNCILLEKQRPKACSSGIILKAKISSSFKSHFKIKHNFKFASKEPRQIGRQPVKFAVSRW
jgi:hypothetical protein